MRQAWILLIPTLLACQSRAAEVARPIGTAHPIDVIRSATDGRWVAICQARRDTDDKPGIEVKRSRRATSSATP